jgi:hypothetical protein
VKVLGLGLEDAGSGVNLFGNVQPRQFSPVRFLVFKESHEVFSALSGQSRIGEFLKRKQGRLGMREWWR